MKNTYVNPKIVLLILPFVLIGCGLFGDNSPPAIEHSTDEINQLVAVNATRTVEFYITDDDDDDTHTISAFSENSNIATVSVNQRELNLTGTVYLNIKGVAIGSTVVTVSVTDDSWYGNATTEFRLEVTVVKPQVMISVPSPLKESSLNGSVVTLSLIGLTFEQDIRQDNLNVSGIDGIFFHTERISDTEVSVVLSFDYTDFDTDSVLNFTVGPDALEDSYNGPLLTAELPVVADLNLVTVNGPWLWMAVPTAPNPGGGISPEIDSLAEVSNNAVTELGVAKNGMNEGEIVGEFQWTSSSIETKRAYTCKEECSFGFFGFGGGCADLCWLNNITHLFSTLGFRRRNNLSGPTAYALINIVSSSNQDNAFVYVESSDAIKVWLNGEAIGKETATALGCRSVHVAGLFDPEVCTSDPTSNYDPHTAITIPAKLKTGDNLLLVKVQQHGAFWGMIVKLDADFTTTIPRR